MVNESMWKIQTKVSRAKGDELLDTIAEHVMSVSFFEGPGGDYWILEGLCEQEPTPMLGVLEKAYGLEITSEPVPEKNWLEACKQELQPFTVGPFWVYGSHVDPSAPKDKIPILMDAATAFGTGEHPTTSGCMRLIAEAKPAQKPLDLGCGSGILAIAMAKLWQVPVMATDLDPEAVNVAQSYAERNGVKDLVTCQVAQGVEKNWGPFDLVVANILAIPLIQLAEKITSIVGPGGAVILSGILSEQADSVVAAYAKQGFKLQEKIEDSGWVALQLHKN
ncbi:MAG: 50S ribosomal protein L11 methyltransferase [Alphaproteobacteria bacterium]